MKFSDLLSMSVNNLRRRKLRTFLTVLGVVIGTASIVVMVSLGIGLNELTMEPDCLIREPDRDINLLGCNVGREYTGRQRAQLHDG